MHAVIPLRVLSAEVRTARSAVQRGRRAPASAGLERARHDLVLALEQYVDALDVRCIPVPHSLRTELMLHKSLLRWSP